jgi:peptidyl-tRNA hydrolase
MTKDKEEYVQYIVVRKDLVEQMGYGKLAAQCCHASLGVLLEKKYYKVSEEDGIIDIFGKIFPDLQMNKEVIGLVDNDGVKKWLRSRFTKLVVYVKSKQALLNLVNKLDEERIKYKTIYDCCLTKLEPEEENGTTLTCMGIIPINREEVPKCLRKLQLLD